MGSITYAGEGGASAQHTVDTTAAGDIWIFKFRRPKLDGITVV